MTAGPAPRCFLSEIPLFAELPPATLEALARESLVRRYPRGQVLCSEGDPGDSLLLLEEGRVKIARLTAGGQEVVLTTAEAPAAFGELALLDGAPRSATITAQTPVVVRVLGRQTALDLIAREPSVATALLRTMAGMVRATNELLADVLSLDVPGRLAKWLLTRARTHGAPDPAGVVVPLDRSQGEIAAELGTTRVSVNRALKGFEAQGLIALDPERDAVVLLDLPALQAHTG